MANGKLEALLQQQEQIKKEFEQNAQTLIKEYLVDVMRDNPLIEAIAWTQYTPHFNDGDVCEFGVHEPSFRLKGVTGSYEDCTVDDDDGNEIELYSISTMQSSFPKTGRKITVQSKYKWNRDSTYETEEYDVPSDVKSALDAATTVSSDIQSRMEDALKAAFGDGVQIVVTRNNIRVDEYDHD